MIIKVMIDIGVPDGTTHYAGDLTDDPTYFKLKDINGPHWFYYDEHSQKWIFSHHGRTHIHIQSIDDIRV